MKRISISLYLFICVSIGSIFAQDNPIPTPKPQSVTMAEDYIQFMALIMENGGCKLPCWWGFEVGTTTENDWLDFLDSLDINFSLPDDPPTKRGTIGGGSKFFYPLHIATDRTELDYHFLEEGILTGISIKLARPDKWFPSINSLSLSGILLADDIDPQVYFIEASSTDLWLMILDSDKPMFITYTFDDSAYSRDQVGNIILCLDMSFTTNIVLKIENHNFPTFWFDQIQQLIESPDSSYIPIEESNLFNSITEEDLIEKIAQSGGDCFVIENED